MPPIADEEDFFLDITERSSSPRMKKMTREAYKDFRCHSVLHIYSGMSLRRMQCTSTLFPKESTEAGMLLASFAN